MDIDRLKQLDARKLSVKEYDALTAIHSGRGMPSDEFVLQEVIDRELKADRSESINHKETI